MCILYNIRLLFIVIIRKVRFIAHGENIYTFISQKDFMFCILVKKMFEIALPMNTYGLYNILHSRVIVCLPFAKKVF